MWNALMNNMLKEGPLLSAFETDTKGVIYQELITYKVINNMLTKETVTRTFKSDDDYYDSVSHKPICRTANEI
jgi:hypothetical protein|tara:strand:+ start:267 stop:485 length:219 start_codon:yes stop_codon:yes gene_type:complete